MWYLTKFPQVLFWPPHTGHGSNAYMHTHTRTQTKLNKPLYYFKFFTRLYTFLSQLILILPTHTQIPLVPILCDATTPEDAACLGVWLDRLSVPSRHQLHSSLVRSELCVHVYCSILESRLKQTFAGLVHAVSLFEFIYAIKILFNNTRKAVPKAHSLNVLIQILQCSQF